MVLNYNGLELLKNLLPKTIAFTLPNEETQVIVADNASTDQSVEWLQQNHPNIPLIQLDENHGFAGGYNKALEQIDSEYYVLLSSDVEVSENWLPPLIEGLKQREELGACQPKVKSYYQREQFEYAGACGGFIDWMGYPFCRGRIFSNIEEDMGQYEEPMDIFWASGCCFAIKSKVWRELGGLDADFFAHMEEIDLCWRIQGIGYKIGVFPNSVVYHMGGETLSYNSPRKLYLNSRNNYAMLFKNWHSIQLILKLPIKIIIDLFAAFYLLFDRGPKASGAVLKGQMHFLLRLSHWYKIRLNTKRSDIKPKGLYNRSIIVSNFLLRRNSFSNLKKEQFS